MPKLEFFAAADENLPMPFAQGLDEPRIGGPIALERLAGPRLALDNGHSGSIPHRRATCGREAVALA
jgi:hypothetical protein